MEESEKKDAEEFENNSKQADSQNKILTWVIVMIGIVLITLVIWIYLTNSSNNFEYRGIKFEKVKEGRLTFYTTQKDVIYQGRNATYHFYIRTNPEELDDVPFKGEVSILKNMVINMSESENLTCNGDGIISTANLVQIFGALGTKVISDNNASCDPLGRYMFVKIQKSDKNYIEKFGPSCYYINVSNCEILKATEKFGLEGIIKSNG